MTIRVAKDETFVEVGFSQAGKLLVSCGAAVRGVKTAIEKRSMLLVPPLWTNGVVS